MKVAVVFLTFVICALALPTSHHEPGHEDPEKTEMIKKIHEYSKKCAEETGISDETSKKLVNGDFSVRDEPAQCYVKCFFKKVGLMNEEGVPQRDALLEKLKKKKVDVENVDELVDKCIAEKGENECETAFKIYECYRGHVTYTHDFKEKDEKKEEEKKEEKTLVKTEEKKLETTEEKKEEKITEKKLEDSTDEKKVEEKTPEKTEEKLAEKTEEKKDE